jgi:predicted nucleic acid-binding protein
MTAKNRVYLLDSSCWIEVLRSGPLINSCRKYLENAAHVIVPTLVIYEVYRKIAGTLSDEQGLSSIALMSQHQIVDLNRDIALGAADVSLKYKLSMADSIILSHAQNEKALLVTLDNDFSAIPNCKVLR